MKTIREFFVLLVFGGSCLLPLGSAPARRVSERMQASAERLGDSIARFNGSTVRTETGSELGMIRDILADAYSGRVMYAAVLDQPRTQLKLVPFAALEPAPTSKDFVVRIEPLRWEQVTPIEAHDFGTRPIPLSEAAGKALAASFGRSEATVGNVGGTHLIALAALFGRRVSTGTETIGVIDDVVFDRADLLARVWIVPEKDFAVTDSKFLVSLRDLNAVERDQNVVTTTLTRNDLEQARRSANPPVPMPKGTTPRHTPPPEKE